MMLYSAMVTEGNEVANGWPLGLGNMNTRIRAAAAPPHASCILRSSSFSSFSFSSSNLDTESTESFVPDQSVSLGRLFGIRSANKGSSCGRGHRRRTPADHSHPGLHKGRVDSQGFCVPLLNHVIGKMGRSGSAKRQ